VGRYLDIVNRTQDRLTKTQSALGRLRGRHPDERNEENEKGSVDGVARGLLDRLLDAGGAFEVVRDGDRDVLLWFGPATTVTTDVMAEVHRYKATIIRLLKTGQSPRSRRTWGAPSDQDWKEHPGHPGNLSS
jgi:hypothetical protein